MDLTLSTLFTDHAVLQQNLEVPVWGWSTPGDTVTVRFADQEVRATAGADGKWIARLAPMPASRESRQLTVHNAAGASRVVADVLVGEVWICSGQSNMGMQVHQCMDADKEMADANYPLIRHFRGPNKAVTDPVLNLDAAWTVTSPEIVGSYTASGYFFGRELHRHLNLPIGLINISWGGTIAEAWTSREGLLRDPYFRAVTEQYDAELRDFPERQAQHAALLAEGEAKYYPKDPGNQGLHDGHAEPDTDISDWPEMKLPCNWKTSGIPFNGVIWFRRDVELPEAWQGRDLVLHLGAVDKCDVTYVNGQEVGETPLTPDSWCQPRAYPVPAALTSGSRLTIAVRAFSHVYGAGLIGPYISLSPAGEKDGINLAGAWRYQVEHDFGPVQPFPGKAAPRGPGNPNSPYILYNSLVAPVVPYGIRGAIWYQGESNASQAYRYRSLFRLLIEDWRRIWGIGDFPFLFVQLANFMAAHDHPTESTWAELREAQAMALALPNTGMACITDVGEANDIHPRNKQDVGKRLARWALVKTYESIGMIASGPLFSNAEREGAVMRIRYRYSEGLTTSDDQPLRGFAVCGDDGKFVWADARIDGSTVLVSHPAFVTPREVRYNWADNPAGNLVNAAGLPAAPFRTDSRPGVTWPKDPS